MFSVFCLDNKYFNMFVFLLSINSIVEHAVTQWQLLLNGSCYSMAAVTQWQLLLNGSCYSMTALVDYDCAYTSLVYKLDQ